jgi:hypothetical protein
MFGGVAARPWHVFIRFQSPTPGRRGLHGGVFGLANGLAKQGRLSDQEHATWRAGNDWFDAAYPDPATTDPSIYDRAVNPLATAWFKDSAVHLLERVQPYLDLLAAHDVPCVRVTSRDPGRVIYEDDVQVVVVPHLSDPERDLPMVSRPRPAGRRRTRPRPGRSG